MAFGNGVLQWLCGDEVVLDVQEAGLVELDVGLADGYEVK